MFSRRLPPDLAPNRLELRRAALAPLFDLTLSNPTRAGIAYPEGLLQPLADPRGLVYDPDPCGLPAARAAVAAECARLGRPADPSSIVITASTSEAYALLFKLLCDPGEAV
nr:pyridoxal phosphate-dependent aminotransferase [Acidobacteriota bacterium]